MKSIFDTTDRAELINRITLLNESSTARWGKMNVSQMLQHCRKWDEMALGKEKYKQSFIGRLFGKMALRDMMKDEPIKKNLPTVPSFKIKEDTNVDEEKKRWIKVLDEYTDSSNNEFIHPFFGALTKVQAGFIACKHADHHLRQFNS